MLTNMLSATRIFYVFFSALESDSALAMTESSSSPNSHFSFQPRYTPDDDETTEDFTTLSNISSTRDHVDQGDRTDGMNGVEDERRSSGDNGTDYTDPSSGGTHSGDAGDGGNNGHSLDISSLLVPMFTSTPKEEKAQLCCGGAGDGGGGGSSDDDDGDDHWSHKSVTGSSHKMVKHKNNSEDDELFDETLDKIIGELTYIGEDTEGPKQAEYVPQKEEEEEEKGEEEEKQERNASNKVMTGSGSLSGTLDSIDRLTCQ